MSKTSCVAGPGAEEFRRAPRRVEAAAAVRLVEDGNPRLGGDPVGQGEDPQVVLQIEHVAPGVTVDKDRIKGRRTSQARLEFLEMARRVGGQGLPVLGDHRQTRILGPGEHLVGREITISQTDLDPVVAGFLHPVDEFFR